MNDLILLFASLYFVKQESADKLSIITYNKLDNIWADNYGLQLIETHYLQNGSYQYVLQLK